MNTLSIPLTKRETIWGFCYLVFQYLVMPYLLAIPLAFFKVELNLAQINFIFYCINFIAIIIIFRKFLLRNIDCVIARPALLVKTVIFGLARYMVLSMLVGSIILRLDPDFVNANDAAINEMVESNLPLMALGTIVLVPPVEECLFRGLIFRNLFDRSKALAYIVSVVAFSAIHLVSYLGVYTPTELLIGFLQYLPAGLCLAWSYTRADTIFAPILIHSIVNAMGIGAMR